ncbi:DUF1648 domain-containing protein [Arthrobacter sp. 35W]|uniref:DUF1648 domain-containing protein n=1 Tax=Arthrobacter sp. 35W TaxID=1132441 RepID=UPI0003FF470A|nr:DUF1648 domain-containing protein [Arthrobacter sp. 35W]
MKESAAAASTGQMRRGVNWWWLAVPTVLLLGTAVYGILRYPSLPELIATHWDAHGEANGFSAKSVGAAFTGVFAFAGFLLVMAGVSVLVAKAPLKNPAGVDEHMNLRQGIASSNASLTFLGILTNAMSVVMAAAALMVFSTSGVSVPVYVPMILVFGGLAVGGWVAWRQYRRELATAGQPSSDADGHWIAGMIYNNPDDERVLVPKLVGIGLTVNWARTGGKFFYLGILALVLLAPLVALLA